MFGREARRGRRADRAHGKVYRAGRQSRGETLAAEVLAPKYDGADGVVVRNLGAKNGVVVNGARVTDEHPLADADVIEIGPVALTLDDPAGRYLRELEQMPAEAVAPAPPPPEPLAVPAPPQVAAAVPSPEPPPAPKRTSTPLVAAVAIATLLLLAVVVGVLVRG